MSTNKRQSYRLVNGTIAGGRITLYADPRPDWYYSLGLDFAYGLQHGDFDAAVMVNQHGEQIATAVGHWGERFAQVLAPLIRWYKPFIVGERSATGIPVLRAMDDAGFWIYYERDENKKSRPRRDTLGVPTSQKGLLLRWLQTAIAPSDELGNVLPSQLTLRDDELLTQLTKYTWRARSSTVDMENAGDEQLMAGAPDSEHDDLVSALMHANAGRRWLPMYDPPKPKPAADSMAAIGIGLIEPEKKKGPWG